MNQHPNNNQNKYEGMSLPAFNHAQFLYTTIHNFANSIQAYANSHGYYVTVSMHHLPPHQPYHAYAQQVPFAHPAHVRPQHIIHPTGFQPTGFQPVVPPVVPQPVVPPTRFQPVVPQPVIPPVVASTSFQPVFPHTGFLPAVPPTVTPSASSQVDEIIIKKEAVDDNGETTETDEESVESQDASQDASQKKDDEDEVEIYTKPKLGKSIEIDIQAHRNNTRYQCVSKNPIHVKQALEESSKSGQCVKTWLLNVPYTAPEGIVLEQTVHMYQFITQHYVIFTSSGTSLLAPFISRNHKNTSRYLTKSFVNGLHYCIAKVYNGRRLPTQIVSSIGLEEILNYELEVQPNYASALKKHIQPHVQVFLKK